MFDVEGTEKILAPETLDKVIELSNVKKGLQLEYEKQEEILNSLEAKLQHINEELCKAVGISPGNYWSQSLDLERTIGRSLLGYRKVTTLVDSQ
jgi:hypothetical protein